MQLIREGGGDNWRLRAAKKNNSIPVGKMHKNSGNLCTSANKRIFDFSSAITKHAITLPHWQIGDVTLSLAHSLTDAVILSLSWILTHKSFSCPGQEVGLLSQQNWVRRKINRGAEAVCWCLDPGSCQVPESEIKWLTLDSSTLYQGTISSCASVLLLHTHWGKS